MLRKITVLLLTLCSLPSEAENWPRFRGPGGTGVAEGSADVPITWSPRANLAWKKPLPGPGASSPIIVDGKVFVTCYSGYGLSLDDPGDIENLVRHLICIDIATGERLWQQDVKVSLPEDSYTGTGVSSHGYASHTPVSDGKNVYAFFGKSGVHAFDMHGKKLWQSEVGKESDPPKWGSASSPIVYNNTVIVTASAESQAIIGFDSATGKELWRQEAQGLDGMWGTPVLVEVDENRTDLVMCVAKELWGLDPNSGKLRWYADATDSQQAYASVVVQGKRVFAFTGGGSIALDVRGSGDVSNSNTVWTGAGTSRYASPVLFNEKLYVVASGVLTVVDAKTGQRVQQLRLKGAEQTGGRFGSLDYPSPVIVGDRLYYLNERGQTFVFAVGKKLNQLGINQVTEEKETFWGSPAVSDGRMVLRSSKYVYCIAGEAKSVNQDELGNRLADRVRTFDNEGDGAISTTESRSGDSTLLRRGGGESSGDVGYGGSDARRDRPQRPEPATGH